MFVQRFAKLNTQPTQTVQTEQTAQTPAQPNTLRRGLLQLRRETVAVQAGLTARTTLRAGSALSC